MMSKYCHNIVHKQKLQYQLLYYCLARD